MDTHLSFLKNGSKSRGVCSMLSGAKVCDVRSTVYNFYSFQARFKLSQIGILATPETLDSSMQRALVRMNERVGLGEWLNDSYQCPFCSRVLTSYIGC